MRNIKAIPGLPFKINEFQDITDTLPSRSPDPESVRTPEQITHISVHHSAVEGGTIMGYANYHVNTLGWAHIGYHIVIKEDQIFQVNDLMTFSYHTSSNNSYTIGISVSADFSKREPSEVERTNLYAAILTVMDLFKIPVDNVMGHNEYPQNNTACPCIDMNKVRNDIRTLQNQMIYANSDAAAKIRAHAIANQILYFCNLSQGKDSYGNPATEGDIQWGKNVLLELEPFMVERGLL